MVDESRERRSQDRTWSAGSATPPDAGQHGIAGHGRARLFPIGWLAISLCVGILTGSATYAEAGTTARVRRADSVTPTAERSPTLLPPGCDIRIERWEESCIENPGQADADASDPVPDVVVDLDRFSLARQQRDKDHLVYRSSKASGPQFSVVVVEPRTRAFNLGLHLRFEYAF